MTSIRRALVFGFLVWVIPFVVAFAIFPLRESARPLFESIMPVALGATVAILGVRYFRDVPSGFVGEGIRLGVLWLAMSLGIDAPLMLLGGPMLMTPGQYLADIGLTYLLIPVITVGIGAARAHGAPPA